MENEKIDRLLRSAALGKQNAAPQMPFGFDTRVVALWRATVNDTNGLTRLVRRVALLAVAVIVVAAAGAFREVSRGREISDLFGNEFAIADSVIEDELWP